MAYVPMQMWNKTYDPDVGICRGTIFPELDLPFIGEEAVPCGK
ncbi:spore coat associated protein CotJA [Acetivibrio sp. MSJd-27]|nr:spore coat associated protein CotJA [Acetivibrio sp. MSJd-27]